MAKEDFCFTYYDGDALRDMSHMNRLERGAYNDLVLQQRKFGRMTVEQIKKILGKDFDECWPSVNLVLMYDEPSKKYWIEWLEKSVIKAKKHSIKQKENVTKRYQKSTKQIPKGKTVTPLGDGDVNGDGTVIKKNKKESLEKLNERLAEVYTEQHSEALKMAYRDVDVEAQWPKFQVKVRGAPDFYSLHTSEGLRMAFQRHLEGATKKKSKTEKKEVSLATLKAD